MKLPLCAAALLLLAGCDGDTPTSPAAAACVDVFRSEAAYLERAEPEVVFEGRLTKNCPPSSPGGRDHCFHLGATPVYSGSRDDVLDRYVGTDITMRGKMVTILGGQEIWPAAVCRQP